MGTSQSSAQPSPEEVAKQRERSRHVMAFKRLYGELNAPDHSGQPATADIFKVETQATIERCVYGIPTHVDSQVTLRTCACVAASPCYADD